MTTFFSATDTNTLKEEGRDRNHFVSLIVNNAGTYTAAVTRRVKSTRTVQESYSYNTFGDETISNIKEYPEEVEIIEYFELNIEKEEEPVSFQDIDRRLEEIRKRKATQPKRPSASLGSYEISPKIPSLFDSEDLKIIESEPPRFSNTTEENNKVPSTTYDINEEDVKQVLLQLITGSIILRDPSKIDIQRWVNSMPQVFGERFGVDDKGKREFENWAESQCEFLLLNKEPNNIELAKDEQDWVSTFAISLYEELNELPQNEYIKMLKRAVEQWIV